MYMYHGFSVTIPLDVISPSVFDIGRYKSPKLPCYLRANILLCLRRHVIYYSDIYKALLCWSISWTILFYTVGCYHFQIKIKSQTINHDQCFYIRVFHFGRSYARTPDRGLRPTYFAYKNCNNTVFYKHAQWKAKLASLNSHVLRWRSKQWFMICSIPWSTVYIVIIA